MKNKILNEDEVARLIGGEGFMFRYVNAYAQATSEEMRAALTEGIQYCAMELMEIFHKDIRNKVSNTKKKILTDEEFKELRKLEDVLNNLVELRSDERTKEEQISITKNTLIVVKEILGLVQGK